MIVLDRHQALNSLLFGCLSSYFDIAMAGQSAPLTPGVPGMTIPSTPHVCPSTPQSAFVFGNGPQGVSAAASSSTSGSQSGYWFTTPTGAFVFSSRPQGPSAAAATPGRVPENRHYHYHITGNQCVNFNVGTWHDNRQCKQQDRSRSPLLGHGGDEHGGDEHGGDERCKGDEISETSSVSTGVSKAAVEPRTRPSRAPSH